MGRRFLLGAPPLLAIAALNLAAGRREPAAPPPRLPTPSPVRHEPRPPDRRTSPPDVDAPAASPGLRVVDIPPYPLTLPPVEWSAPRREAWHRLKGARVSVDARDLPLSLLLRDVAETSGQEIFADGDVQGLPVTFKASDILLDGVLKLLRGPHDLDFDLLDDGRIRVGRPENVRAEFTRDVARINRQWRELEAVGDRLNAGPAAFRLSLPAFETTARDNAMETICDLTLRSRVGLEFSTDLPERAARPLYRVPFDPRPGRSLGEQLDLFCAQFGLGWSLTAEDLVRIDLAGEAPRGRHEAELRRVEDRRLEDALNGPAGPSPIESIPDLAGRVGRVLGIPVLVTPSVWDSPFRPYPAATFRQALLDLEGRHILRWTIQGGTLFAVGPRGR